MEYQKQLLSVVRSLVSVSQQDLVPVTQDLFTVTMSVLGMAADPTITRQAQGKVQAINISSTVSTYALCLLVSKQKMGLLFTKNKVYYGFYKQSIVSR